MDLKITYERFCSLCRFCLIESEDLQQVLDWSILKVFNDLSTIKIDPEDDLPKKACNQCTKQLDSIYSFVEKCKENDRILRTALEEKTTVHCTEDSALKLESEDNSQDIPHSDSTDEEFTKNERNKKQGLLCQACKTCFTTRTYLNRHYRENDKCRPKNFKIHKCEVCTKEFTTSRQKKEHLNVHTGETPYTCSYCGKGFKFHSKLYVHVYRHKVALGEIEEKGVYNEKRVRLNLRCDKCAKVFASRSGHARHMLKHQGIKIMAKKYVPVKIDKNNRPYLCNYCAKSFYLKANLEAHLRVHTGERPFECKTCGMRFKQKGSLDRHTLNHLEERPKPFCCDICQKTFTTKSHMETHKRLHTGEKPYTCSFCGKSFNYRSHWRVHLRMHTGENPYCCPVCSNRYHDRSSMRKHQKKKGHFEQSNNEKCDLKESDQLGEK